ncbi:Hypothetical predicted protein [Pelobates cultripes]|uniref:Uncharacterized protein n=1 Tax=Pelobates cultripes TaxID=61616 RepID=A0AAD1RDF9_PELCU|nr:Hypothetical predicted protein [Pelobates cultripes]
MSPNRSRKPTEVKEVKDKGAFFTARTTQSKLTDTGVQDGADAETEGDTISDTDIDPKPAPAPALAPAKNVEALLTPKLLQEMLDKAVIQMQTAVATAIADLREDLIKLDTRTIHLETKVEVVSGAYEGLKSRINVLEDKMLLQDSKLMDFEDRSRRNNIKVRGIPEEVGSQELGTFMLELFQSVLPDFSQDMFLLDRIHRLIRPQFLPASSPRDVLLRVHYYHVKEQIMRAYRAKENRPEKYKEVLLFADLSSDTLRFRRSFKDIIETLRANDIRYKWGYPAKLFIIRDGKFNAVSSPTEGSRLLQEWGLIPDSPSEDQLLSH